MSLQGISYAKEPLSIQPEESNGKDSYAERSMNLSQKTRHKEKEKLQRDKFQVTMGKKFFPTKAIQAEPKGPSPTKVEKVFSVELGELSGSFRQ